MITGAFRSTATVVLDYHADLLPTELRLNQVVHRAAVRLASLPVHHPLHASVRRCMGSLPRLHRSPLHLLFHSFPEVRGVQPTGEASASPSADPACEFVVGDGKEDARAQAADALASRDTCVFTHGCSGSQVGAAAVTAIRDGGRVSLRASLGPAAQRQVHDGALAAVTLAVCAVLQCPRVTRASILVPDRAAVTTLTSRPGHPLSQLFWERLRVARRARSSLRIRVIWAPLSRSPGSTEHLCCQAHDDVRAAAEGFESPAPQVPTKVLAAFRSLGVPAAVLLKQYDAQVHEQWRTAWAASRQGRRLMRAVSDTAPGPSIRKLYRGLPRRQCSILTQLRCGHSGLNAFLAKIRAIDSGLCLACNVPETVAHFMLTCRRFVAPRHDLRQAIGGPLSLRSTLGDPEARAAVLAYVEATGRFPQYRPPL